MTHHHPPKTVDTLAPAHGTGVGASGAAEGKVWGTGWVGRVMLGKGRDKEANLGGGS